MTPQSTSAPLTLAGQALRDGVRPLMRSFRLHRARSGFCHAGWCQQCRVTLADGRVVLACETPADGNTVVAATPGYKRLLGRIAEGLPPWFYETRFLRPAFLRQWFLGRLRGFSAAPAAPVALRRAAPKHATVATDVLVVGGGLAGLHAATAAARLGRRVELVEARHLGGHARFARGGDPAVGKAIEAARAVGVRLREQGLCVGLYDVASDAERRALVVGSAGTLTIRFARLVIASGAYDRLPAFPRNDLPGVIGGRAFERLVAQAALPAGATIGVWGDATGIQRAHDVARQAGLAIAWTVGTAGDAPESQRLGQRVTGARGVRRLGAVAIDGGRWQRTNVLVVAFSQPGYELQTQLGLAPALCGDPVALRFACRATDAVLTVGEAAAPNEATGAAAIAQTVRDWLQDARRVGVAVLPEPSAAAPLSDECLVCLCEDVKARDIRAAVADGYRDIELVKRHTGAGTGPCQGKLCHAELLRCAALAGVDVRLPTARPLVRPVALHHFRASP